MILWILLGLVQAIATKSVLELYSASVSLGSSSDRSLVGSFEGGTIIYINGIGFSDDPTLISVYIGNFPCIVPAQGVTTNFLICETTKVDFSIPYTNLQIQVIQQGQPEIVPGYIFSYNHNWTPLIMFVKQPNSIPGSLLNFYGYHRIRQSKFDPKNPRNLKHIVKMEIGDALCDTLQLWQPEIYPHRYERLRCQSSIEREAGKFNVTQQLTIGYARKNIQLRRASLQEQYYEHIVLPLITKIDYSKGFKSGQIITIHGKGYSVFANKITVNISGIQCEILQATYFNITCRVKQFKNWESLGDKVYGFAPHADPFFADFDLYIQQNDIPENQTALNDEDAWDYDPNSMNITDNSTDNTTSDEDDGIPNYFIDDQNDTWWENQSGYGNSSYWDNTTNNSEYSGEEQQFQEQYDPYPNIQQSRGFVGGLGFKLFQYNLNHYGWRNFQGLKRGLDIKSQRIKLVRQKIITQLYLHNQGGLYGKVAKGYFKAPVSGMYIFRGSADDSYGLYISGFGLQSNIPYIYDYHAVPQTQKNYYIYNRTTSFGRPIYLEQGKHYYMELYMVNIVGGGYVRISVQVPNTNKNLPYQSYEVNQIQTSVQTDPQIRAFMLMSTDVIVGGQFTLYIRRFDDPFALEPSYEKYRTVPYNATEQQFKNILLSFDIYSNCNIQVSFHSFNSQGYQVDLSQATILIWNVKIDTFRKQSITQQLFSTKLSSVLSYGLVYFSEQIIQQHSPLISGNFTLHIQDIPVNIYDSISQSFINDQIPYNVDPKVLQAGLQQIEEINGVEVLRFGNCQLGCKYLISYYNTKIDVPDLFTSTAGLLGGKTGTRPKVQFYQTRKYSPNIIFTPVDAQFLFNYQNQPQVNLQINQIRALCWNCNYQFIEDSPQIIEQNLNNNTVQVFIETPQDLNISSIQFTASLAGQTCEIISGDLNYFMCTLPINNDGSPKISAGEHNIQVFIDQLGYVGLSNTSYPITFPFIVNSLNHSSVGLNGGYPIYIQGEGFPFNVEEVKICICGFNITAIEISNTHLIIIIPPCNQGIQTLTFQYNLYIVQQQITYFDSGTIPFISDLLPHSSSPVLKSVMQIQGGNFPDQTLMKVYLANYQGRKYQMRIISANETYIQCGIPGGMPGQFYVQVAIQGQGNALPISEDAIYFAYQVVVESITPSTGLFFGGTLISIKGRNFCPDKLENLVGVSNQMNWLCELVQVSQTQIKCRTPRYNPYWKKDTQRVYVTSRVLIDNTCQGNCYFTYLPFNQSMVLQKISATKLTSGLGTLKLEGKNFSLIPTDDLRVSFENQVTKQITQVIPFQANDTYVIINTPNLEAGYYSVKVRADPLGQTNSHSVQLYPYFVYQKIPKSPSGGSIKIEGGGLPASWPRSGFSIWLKSSQGYNTLEITSCQPSFIQLDIPPFAGNFEFKIKSPNKISRNIILYNQIAGTPIINIITPTSPVSISQQSLIQLEMQSSIPAMIPLSVSIYHVNAPQHLISFSFVVQAITNIIKAQGVLKTGKYGIKVQYQNGWAICNQFFNVQLNDIPLLVGGLQQCSYKGCLVEMNTNSLGFYSQIIVGGFKGKVIQYTSASTIFKVPELITLTSIQTFPNLIEAQLIIPESVISDGGSNPYSIIDGQFNSNYQSNNPNCFIGIDVGDGNQVLLERIRYFPYSRWVAAQDYLIWGTIEASKDNINYDVIYTIEEESYIGWNTILFENMNQSYRYFIFNHTSQSKCMIAQFEVYGIQINTQISETSSDIVTSFTINDGSKQYEFIDSIQYKQAATPIIEDISPKAGSVFGGYNITLIGSNLGNLTVIIDGVICQVQYFTNTEVICLTGDRTVSDFEVGQDENTFYVMLNNQEAIIQKTFLYVNRWSDIRTWGTDLPPVQGDLVYVPKGQSIYVDISTPRLQGIYVQGKIIFADEGPMTIHSNFIIVVRGEFRAGTEQQPYQNQLTFVMYGSYHGKQLPMFGNKAIGCKQCKFSMYGQPRKTWTMLQNTIYPGSDQFQTIQDVDWKVGDQIVVASTNFNHKQAQKRKIINIVNNRVITVDRSFSNHHYGDIEHYGTHSISMRAQVALLTRNIKMMGDPTSRSGQYGSHLMMTGKSYQGMVSHIAYTQFTDCGQPRIVGRYCIHFHMNGDVTQSYVKGNSVHNSFARILTLHGVHYLRATYNVGYWVKGHNFFIEDGIQTHNLLQYNLAICSLAAQNMMQTDTSVASFWITNPLNNVRYNHAAGGDFYGFWYQIKPRPDGPSATSGICPQGNRLGESHDNVAHSYVRFGLRILKMASRRIPCRPISGRNPSILARFYNYVMYKNGEAGLLAQSTGNMHFDNFTIAQSRHAGMQFYSTALAPEPVIALNSHIIGITQFNRPGNLRGSGIISPKTQRWTMRNINFYNFVGGMVAFKTCSGCDSVGFINIGIQFSISQIYFHNMTGRYYEMMGMRKDIIRDTDGTFTANFDQTPRTSAQIVANMHHLRIQPACFVSPQSGKWDNCLVCNQSISIRKVTFSGVQPAVVFSGKTQRIKKIDNTTVPYSMARPFSSTTSGRGTFQPMVRPFTWALPYATNRTYQTWWHPCIEFINLRISVGGSYQQSQPGIVFRLRNYQPRQLYEVRGRGLIKPYTGGLLNHTICPSGNYTYNSTQKNLTICASAKLSRLTRIKGFRCKYLCPKPIPEDKIVPQTFIRLWSNATQWPNNTLPKDGDNVTIPGNWTLIMDINPPIMQIFQVRGQVWVSDSLDNVHIIAEHIWIRRGKFQAGTKQDPFEGNLTFQIIGNKTDDGMVIDPVIAGTKLFVVTAELFLYGIVPQTTWTKLMEPLSQGQTKMKVQNHQGWKIGDRLVIGPSYSSHSQHQVVNITNITQDYIEFTPGIKHPHYGQHSLTIDNEYGTLDTRSAVGILSRNIKIVTGNDTNWGFRMIGYGFKDGKVSRVGHLILQGVQFINGGQPHTQYPALKLERMVSSQMSYFVGNSFSGCKLYCLDIVGSQNLRINNNVFYNGKMSHVRALSIRNYHFKNNLMIAVQKGSIKGVVSCYTSYNSVPQSVIVSDNVCQGSDSHGFAITLNRCSDNFFSYTNNTVNSASVGFILNKAPGACQIAKGLKAFACGIGQISSPSPTNTLIFQNFIMAECGRAVTLRFGQQGKDNTAYFRNSYITAISRPTCTECYGSGKIDCTGNQAVRMLVVTVNGQNMPGKSGPGFDVICKHQSFDAKVFIDDVIFDHYQVSYDNLPQCRSNKVFRPHSAASDITGSHNLYNTKCTNCDMQSLAFFDAPSRRELGWFGGCGTMVCTGKRNYLIHDYTGGFLPQPGILISNNRQIGDNTDNCSFIPQIQGHYCEREDFGVLQYQSIAPDFNKRVIWPVYLKFQGGRWNTSTNAWKEWQWQGGQPLNKRLGRFVSIVQLYQIYNMTFESQPPIDIIFQFQRRTKGGDNSQYIIVKMKYPRPNSIRVQNRGKVMRPIPVTQQGQYQALNTSQCGSNMYFYRNYTVHFVITGHKNCRVRVSLTNSIQLTIRYSMDINQFYNIDGKTKVIDRICATLGLLDTSRLKIVGIFKGSVVIKAQIDEPNNDEEDAKTHDNKAAAKGIQQLNDLLNSKFQSGQIGALFPQDEGFGPIDYFSTSVSIHQQQQQALHQNEYPLSVLVSQNKNLVIALCLAITAILIFIGAAVYKKLHNKKTQSAIYPVESEQEKMAKSTINIQTQSQKSKKMQTLQQNSELYILY